MNETEYSAMSLSDMFAKMASIFAQMAGDDAKRAHEQALDAMQLARSEEQNRIEQKKRELLQRDQVIADELKKLEAEKVGLENEVAKLHDRTNVAEDRLYAVSERIRSFNSERTSIHKQWCAEFAAPENTQAKASSSAKKLTRTEWLRAAGPHIGVILRDDQLRTAVRRIGELVSGRVYSSRLFDFGDRCDITVWKLVDLYELGEEIGLPFPG